MTEESTVTVRRVFGAINLVIFLVSVVVIAVAANFFSLQPSFRAQIDATKTRAYSLSPQTRNLLTDLEGDWTIALLVSERFIDAPREGRSMRSSGAFPRQRRASASSESIRPIRAAWRNMTRSSLSYG